METSVNDFKESNKTHCIQCFKDQRIITPVNCWVGLLDRKESILLSHSVRLNPCGCVICKDCFLQYVIQHRLNPIMLCPSCDNAIHSHRTSITEPVNGSNSSDNSNEDTTNITTNDEQIIMAPQQRIVDTIEHVWGTRNNYDALDGKEKAKNGTKNRKRQRADSVGEDEVREDEVGEDNEESASDDECESETEEDNNNPTSVEENTKRSTKRRYCCHPTCNNKTTNNPTLRMKRVPPLPPELKPNANDIQIRAYEKKIILRHTWMKNLGLSVDDERKDLRICHAHQLVSHSCKLKWTTVANEEKEQEINITVPETEAHRQMRSGRKSLQSSRISDEDNDNDSVEYNGEGNEKMDDYRRDIIAVRRMGLFAKRKSAQRKKKDEDEAVVTKKKRGSSVYCAYAGCRVKDDPDDKSIRFHRVPKFRPTKITRKQITNRELKRQAIRKDFVTEFRRAIGCSMDGVKHIRICNQHSMVKKKKTLYWSDKNGKIQQVEVEHRLPAALGDARAAVGQVDAQAAVGQVDAQAAVGQVDAQAKEGQLQDATEMISFVQLGTDITSV